MSYQPEMEKSYTYEKETVVRNAGNPGPVHGSTVKDGPAIGPRTHERYTDHLSSTGFANGKGARSTADDPSLREYLKGFSKVGKKCLREYKEVLFDVTQSLLVLFMQHPSVGILFLITGLFVVVPLGVFLGFAVVSFISIVVTALFLEGVLLGSGLVVLFFVVPIAFICGISVAAFVTATYLTITTAYTYFRGMTARQAEKTTVKME